MWLVILLYAIYASSFPISKLLLAYAPPLFVSSMRTLVAGLVLMSYYLFTHAKRKPLHINILYNIHFIQIVVIGIYVNYIARFWALNNLPSAKACLIFSLDPVLSLFFSYLVFGETTTRRQVLGFVFGFFALIAIIVTSSPLEEPFGKFMFVSWPEFFMLVSVMANSYRWVLIRKLVRNHYKPELVNGLSMTLGGSLAFLTSYLVDGYFPVQAPASFFGWLFLAIFISNIICATLYAYLLRSYTATFLSLAGFTTPLFAALYGSFLFQESMHWLFYFSTFLLLVSLYLFYQDEGKIAGEPDEELVSS